MADIISVQGDQISPPSFRKQLTTPNLQPDPTFAFLPFLARTYGFGYAPKNDRPFCEAFRRGECPLGPSCPDQHVIPINERSGIGHLICKHYQRGLCKKGDACEFAHTFDLRSERECKEFSRFGICPQGDECTYIHLPPSSHLRLPACLYYARGFCPLGPYCALRHIRHVQHPCALYIAGFCPEGRIGPPDRDGVVFCSRGAHPRFFEDGEIELPKTRKIKTEEERKQEQEDREEEFFAEEERRRERFERGEGGVGRGWGRRRRGRAGGNAGASSWRGGRAGG